MKGVTKKYWYQIREPMDFNSHAREGRDTRRFDGRISRVISTHTPVKGVTAFRSHLQHLQSYFNSHAREGRDLKQFQIGDVMGNFNSHAREGRDFLFIPELHSDGISTHTPVKGVTQVPVACFAPLQISTHTPVKGVTGFLYGLPVEHLISTHTPVKGVTTFFYH